MSYNGKVGEKEKNHELVSVVTTVDVGDTVRVTGAADGKFTLSCDDAAVPADETNLVFAVLRISGFVRSSQTRHSSLWVGLFAGFLGSIDGNLGLAQSPNLLRKASVISWASWSSATIYGVIKTSSSVLRSLSVLVRNS